MQPEDLKKGDKVMFLGNLDHDPYWEKEIHRLGLNPMQVVRIEGTLGNLLYIDLGKLGALFPFKYFQKVNSEEEL